MNAATNTLVGSVVEVLWRVDLLEVAVLEYRHPVAHGHRFDLIVGHVDRGDTEVTLDTGDLGTHLDPQLGVEVRQRLVHQERRGLAHDGTPHRDTLALATRQLTGLAIEIGGELEDVGRLADPLVDLVLRDLRQLEREADVVVDAHVRVQRIVLEHHRDVSVLGLDIVDHTVTDP